MSIEEVAEVLAYIALIDGREVTEGMVLAWHQILGPTPVTRDRALENVRQCARTSSAWITPSDVVGRLTVRERYESRR